VRKAEALANDEAMQERRRAIADPLRMRILGLLNDSQAGMTANELGEGLAMNPNRLYYHLRILETAGVIGVVDTRATGRMVERVYDQIYRGRFIWDAENPLELAMYLGSQLEVARTGAEEALFEQARCVGAGERSPVVTWGQPSFATTHDEIVEFTKRLDALQHEFRERASKLESRADEMRQLRFTWLVYEQDAPRSP
jgi:DNA-binding transcriptional ArsR family regulator